jgi:hypothetical protein
MKVEKWRPRPPEQINGDDASLQKGAPRIDSGGSRGEVEEVGSTSEINCLYGGAAPITREAIALANICCASRLFHRD